MGSSVWGRVVVGLVRVCGLARFGAFWGVRDWSAGLWREVFLTLRDRLRVFSSRIGGCAVVVVWSC